MVQRHRAEDNSDPKMPLVFGTRAKAGGSRRTARAVRGQPFGARVEMSNFRIRLLGRRGSADTSSGVGCGLGAPACRQLWAFGRSEVGRA
jgi:hypothetical protein